MFNVVIMSVTYYFLCVLFCSSVDPPPTILCPPNLSANPNSGTNTAFIVIDAAMATDDSPVTPTIQYTTDSAGVQILDGFGTPFIYASNVPVGVTTVTATATDDTNNMASCTFTITG